RTSGSGGDADNQKDVTTATSSALRVRLGLLLVRMRAAHVARARGRVIGPAERRLGTDVDVHETRTRIDPDAHTAGVERRRELVEHLFRDARDANVGRGAMEMERRGAPLIAETGDELDALTEVVIDARQHLEQ